jgi:hypothetical protein
VTSPTSIIEQNAQRIHSQADAGKSQLQEMIAALEDVRIEVGEIGLRHPTLDEV